MQSYILWFKSNEVVAVLRLEAVCHLFEGVPGTAEQAADLFGVRLQVHRVVVDGPECQRGTRLDDRLLEQPWDRNDVVLNLIGTALGRK